MDDPAEVADPQEEFRQAVRRWALTGPRDLRIAFTLACLKDPRPGDAYHEMFTYYMHVLVLRDDVVTVEHGSGASFTVSDFERAEFVKHFSYATIPGTWVELSLREDRDVTEDMINDWWRTAAGGGSQ